MLFFWVGGWVKSFGQLTRQNCFWKGLTVAHCAKLVLHHGTLGAFRAFHFLAPFRNTKSSRALSRIFDEHFFVALFSFRGLVPCRAPFVFEVGHHRFCASLFFCFSPKGLTPFLGSSRTRAKTFQFVPAARVKSRFFPAASLPSSSSRISPQCEIRWLGFSFL